MTATNMCSNFGGKWDSPPLIKLANDLAATVVFNSCVSVSRSHPQERQRVVTFPLYKNLVL